MLSHVVNIEYSEQIYNTTYRRAHKKRGSVNNMSKTRTSAGRRIAVIVSSSEA